MISTTTTLWNRLSPSQQALARDGEFLLSDVGEHPGKEPSDYSYLVFCYAKLYEGFLKQLFLDLGIMTQQEYTSDHYRIGKTLSPYLAGRLRHKSAYGQIEKRYGSDLARQLWLTWKNGRNLVFHYFPHNYRALTYDQARTIIVQIVDTMNRAVEETKVKSETYD